MNTLCGSIAMHHGSVAGSAGQVSVRATKGSSGAAIRDAVGRGWSWRRYDGQVRKVWMKSSDGGGVATGTSGGGSKPQRGRRRGCGLFVSALRDARGQAGVRSRESSMPAGDASWRGGERSMAAGRAAASSASSAEKDPEADAGGGDDGD